MPPRDGAYNFLRTQHFHGVSSGNRHTYLLKSRYGKVRLDELLGPDSFCNHIIWSYKRWPSVSSIYQRMHDDILFYRKDQKGSDIRFKVHYEAVSESYQKRF